MKLTKKFLSLVLVLCLFFSVVLTANALDDSGNIGDDGGTVSPLWNEDTHLSIIDRAYSACDITIPETYLTLMNRISNRCDVYWQSHMAFHSRGNYLATQKFCGNIAV